MVKKVEKSKKNLKNKKILKKNEKKTVLISISSPFWIMKNLSDSGVSIVIVPKSIRQRLNGDSRIRFEYCFFSTLTILGGLDLDKYSSFLKQGLIIKFTKIFEFLVHQYNSSNKLKILLGEKCIYDKTLCDNITLSCNKILEWKKYSKM